jgi:hypothetical protein
VHHIFDTRAALARLQTVEPIALRSCLASAVVFAAHRVLIAICLSYSTSLLRGYLGDVLALPVCVPFLPSHKPGSASDAQGASCA